ncbi:MAG: hypothetical protein RLZZ175_595 [Bacteroidota bacterium]|jgi:hypothetical protein
MIYKFCLIVFINISLFSCSESPKQVSKNRIDIKLDTIVSITNKMNDTLSIDSIRVALVNLDTVYLYLHIDFPLKIKGQLDFSDEKLCDKEHFKKIYKILAIQLIGHSINDKTSVLEFLKGEINPRYFTLSKNWARYGDLIFEKKNNKWLLVEMKIDEEFTEIW